MLPAEFFPGQILRGSIRVWLRRRGHAKRDKAIDRWQIGIRTRLRHGQFVGSVLCFNHGSHRGSVHHVGAVFGGPETEAEIYQAGLDLCAGHLWGANPTQQGLWEGGQPRSAPICCELVSCISETYWRRQSTSSSTAGAGRGFQRDHRGSSFTQDGLCFWKEASYCNRLVVYPYCRDVILPRGD